MTYYEINAAALRHNILHLRRLAGVPIWAVLKYDGYGVGLLTLAHTLRQCGVRHFAVCGMREAMALRSAGYTEDILLLSPQTAESDLEAGLANDIIFSVGDEAFARCLAQTAQRMGRNARAHIAFQRVLRQLRHGGIDYGTAHMANSAAFFRCPGAMLDAVRLGSAVVGRVGGVSPEKTGLQNVGTLVTDVCAVKTLKRGDRVGYDGELRLRRDAELAILSAGSWQGIPRLTARQRLLRAYPRATIGGKPLPIVSTSSASHAMVDVTGQNVQVGDLVRIDVNPLFLNPGVEKRVVCAASAP